MTSADELLKLHPAPWVIDQMNTSGVVVNDCCGRPVFEEWFGDIPDEIRGGVVEAYIASRHALARFLVDWASSANTQGLVTPGHGLGPEEGVSSRRHQ
ncbi:MAG: hypothetical protein QM691_07565 [Opitutaceae bacterium]